jgi:hypothetical protein
LDGGAGAVPTANLPLDTRNPGIQSLNRISNASVGVSGVKLDQIIIQANNDGEFRVLPFVLGPNHRLNIWNTNPNTALTVVMSGFEYLGRSEELAA